MVGVAPNYPVIANLKVSRGRFFDHQDDGKSASVCVIGSAAKRQLFGFEEAVGRDIKINDVWFTVVGVIREKLFAAREFEGVSIQDSNHEIYIPINAALKKFRFKELEDELDELYLMVDSERNAKRTAAVVSSVLRRIHKNTDDFTVIVPQALLEQHQRTRRIFNIVMACIASISLLVGGIGIMNIMLANVLERTREIGLRRAVGARRRDIRWQFLLEAVSVSSFGGLIGVLFGFAVSSAVTFHTNWDTIITSTSILIILRHIRCRRDRLRILPGETSGRPEPDRCPAIRMRQDASSPASERIEQKGYFDERVGAKTDLILAGPVRPRTEK